MKHPEDGAFSQDLGWQTIPPCLGMLFHCSIIHTVKSKGWVLQFHWPTWWCNPSFDVLGDWKALATCRGLPSCLLTMIFSLPTLPRTATRTNQRPPVCLLLIRVTQALNGFPRFYSQMASKSLQGCAAMEALPHTAQLSLMGNKIILYQQPKHHE